MKVHSQYNNLLLFDLLDKEETIAHFSTTRVGGVSHGSYASLNTGNFSDDNPLNIHENRQIIARMFYMEMDRFIIPHQTHGTRVLNVDDEFLQRDHASAIETLYGVDAVITSEKGIFVCVTTADCVPILLYDRDKEVVAAIHAGWRGTVGGIVENTLREMEEHYNCAAQDIIAGIGPAISQSRYEVGEEVIERFRENGFDLSDKAVFYREKSSGRCYLDLKEINRRMLVRLGVPEASIEKSDFCTFDKQELFFSARRQTVHSGRMLSGIMRKGR